METRSVTRNRRRSTRLTGQSTQDDLAKPPTKNKKRDSGHGTSGHSSGSASRESSCPGTDRNSKNASSSPDPLSETQDDKTAKATTSKEATKDKDDGTALPLFPHLPAFKANIAAFHGTGTEPIPATRKKSVDTTSERARKDHVSNKWVKTARGSIRLASDAPAEASKDDTDKKVGEVHKGQNAPSAAAGRRSRRLASMSPDVTDELSEVEPLRSRRPRTVKAEVPPPVTAGSDEPQEWELNLQDRSAKLTTEKGLSSQSTHNNELSANDELPTYDGKTDVPLDKEPDHLKNITPIPELVADIERIIQSSPLAAKDAEKYNTKGTSSPTPDPAANKRAPAGMLTRSRTRRASSRLIDEAARSGKNLDLEGVDSDSSQFDGAYDDSIQGQKRMKAQLKRGKTKTTKLNEPRGSKRSAQELSESEANAPSLNARQRRNPASDHSTPEVDLSTSNPIEAATSRDAFAVDDPNVEMAVGISEFARQSGEPPNPVTLAQMISNSPERATDSDNDSILARDGSQSQRSSLERTFSDADSTLVHQGSRESSRPQSPETDTPPTCADCGRAPERYIVCARCLVAAYCGKYCQLWSWPVHKTRCEAADGAVQEAVDAQEKYLGDMWAAALRVLEEEENNSAGGTVESLLLGEAVRHSGGRPSFMGRGRPHHGFGGIVNTGSSRSLPRNSEVMDGARAMSIQLARTALGGDE